MTQSCTSAPVFGAVASFAKPSEQEKPLGSGYYTLLIGTAGAVRDLIALPGLAPKLGYVA